MKNEEKSEEKEMEEYVRGKNRTVESTQSINCQWVTFNARMSVMLNCITDNGEKQQGASEWASRHARAHLRILLRLRTQITITL